MLVPTGVHELHKAGAAFDEATGDEAVAGEGSGFIDCGTILLKGGFAFGGNVGELGHAGLHAIGHLVLRNAGGDFGVANFSQFAFVEFSDAVEHVATEL